VCSPTRAVVIQSQLGPLGISPRLVYEPIPDRCVPSELPALRTVLRHLHVFSPNHEEAAAFFGIDADEVERQGKAGVEDVARRFREEGAKFVVIRSGGWGAFTLREGEEGFWVKAYWEGRLDKVVDVTGAGNSFLVSPLLPACLIALKCPPRAASWRG
jgi:sugar/nucleoside kinase (ribokinase family)